MTLPYFVGEIRMIAGFMCPLNWVFCNGQLLPVTGNEALFSLLGTAFGGDGRTTFAVPDYRGRLVAGQGSGPGLTPCQLGNTFGTQTVSLTVEQIPNHTHPFNATTLEALVTNPTKGILANPGDGNVLYEAAGTTNMLVPLAADAVGQTGSGLPHNNLMPFLVINFMIAVTGTYPERP